MHLLQLLLPFVSTVAAARLTFTLPPVPQLPNYNPSTLPPSTRATLFRHANTVAVPITRRNTFEFTNVTQGSWLFTVQCRDFLYGPLRVDVVPGEGGTGEKVEAFQTFWGNEWANKGEWRGGGAVVGDEAVVIEVRPEKFKEYYVARGGFSPMQFIKNPMILMGLFSLLLIVGLPYLTENMDEETRAEFEAIQKQSPMVQAANSASGLQNFDLASWMAGKSAGSSANSAAAIKNDDTG